MDIRHLLSGAIVPPRPGRASPVSPVSVRATAPPSHVRPGPASAARRAKLEPHAHPSGRPSATEIAAALAGPPGPDPALGRDGFPKPFACPDPVCGQRFGQKGSMARHVRARHEQRRPHVCATCGKRFAERWTRSVHERNVHERRRAHECGECGARFGERWNLSKHVNVVHRKVKPFPCALCGRCFGYKGDMRKHVLELHATPTEPLPCPMGCGAVFARARYLRRHIALAHGKEESVLARGGK